MVKFIGEHTNVGILGKLSIYFALSTAIISLILLISATLLKKQQHKILLYKITNYSLASHFIGLLSAIIILLTALYKGFYEYAYVWAHTSSNLSNILKLCAIWAGKEGSLLFWLFCQSFLTIIFFFKTKNYKAILFIMIVQSFLTLLISGIHLFSFTIGDSPFILLRELPSNSGNKVFELYNYLDIISKGRGLNPLLKNFWMIIHPPILFAGYSAALITWSIGMSSLTIKTDNYIKTTKTWSLISVVFLLAGILSGGIWGYTTLSFGGFWSWDPIENASLIPLLLIIAGIHLNSTNKFYKTAKIFFIIAYISVIYAGFLTRSGILSNISVHSFNKNKVGWALGLLVILLFILYLYLIFSLLKKQNKYSSIYNKYKTLSIKEWIILLLTTIFSFSAFHIFFNTSIPVFNYLLDSHLSFPKNEMSFYNQWQAGFLILCILILIIYNCISIDRTKNKIFIYFYYLTLLLSVIVGVFVSLHYTFELYPKALSLIITLIGFSSTFISYLLKRKKQNITYILSHLGILIFLTGVIIAFGGKYDLIRDNTLKLYKNKTYSVKAGMINYKGYKIIGNKIIYNIDLKKNNSKSTINLFPLLIYDTLYGDVFEPYVHKTFKGDYFVYIVKNSLNPIKENIPTNNLNYSFYISLYDTMSFTNDLTIILKSLKTNSPKSDIDIDNVTIDAGINVKYKGTDTTVIASFIINKGKIYHKDATLQYPPLVIRFNNISGVTSKIELNLNFVKEDYIIIKAEFFPFINLVWLGLILLFIGLFFKAIGFYPQ
ncbi:MAG TPA: cytochrome c biogenesis protein CcsA [Bacteroidales bacterium]|nr:cytochrome c biogenesis protein CcsA [Bacteroidales bacterium]